MKKRFIGLTFFLISMLAFCQKTNPELTKYVNFLEKQNVSAKDYVLNLFKKYDVVILCERQHTETTQYDLIYDIVSSPYFHKNVGNIFTEVGSYSNRQNTLNFIKTKFSNDSLKQIKQAEIYRNGFFPNNWLNTNFYDFIGKLNSLNSTLSKNKKINLFVSDKRNPNKIETQSLDEFKKYFKSNRDEIMAQNIIKTFDSIQKKSKRKKALVIMNYRHAFSKSFYNDERNTGAILKEKYGRNFANILINNACPTNQVKDDEKDKPKVFQNMTEVLIQDGKWDASFKIAKIENVGFDFQGSPFGKDYFDFFSYTNHKENYQDIFTGFIFYLPIEKLWESYGIKDIVNGHEDEMCKKDSLLMKSLGKEPSPKSEIMGNNKIEIEKYDDLDKLILMRDQWLKN